ncbi:MAG: hypothetical protein R2879_20775 [Saprospiraceae bacterium]
MLKSEAAISNQDNIPFQEIPDSKKSINSKNLALSVLTESLFFDSLIRFGIGYYQVGEQFYTAGNPFILTGRKGVMNEISSKLLKGNLTLSCAIKYSFNSPEFNSLNLAFRDLQIIGEARAKIGKKLIVSAKVMPNNSVRFIGNSESLKGANNVFFFLLNHFHQGKIVDVQSTMTISNLNNRIENIDTSFSFNKTFLTWQENLVISESSSVSATIFSLINSSNIKFEDLESKVEYIWNNKKTRLGIGSILRSKENENKLMAGVSGRLSAKLFGQELGFNISYLSPIKNNKEEGVEIFGNMFFRIII